MLVPAVINFFKIFGQTLCLFHSSSSFLFGQLKRVQRKIGKLEEGF